MSPTTTLLAILLAILAGVAAALLYGPWQRWQLRRAIKQYGRGCGKMEREWIASYKGALPHDVIDLARHSPFPLEQFIACNRALAPLMKKPPKGICLTTENILALIKAHALTQSELGIKRLDPVGLVRQVRNDPDAV